jgi:hypothetical protein
MVYHQYLVKRFVYDKARTGKVREQIVARQHIIGIFFYHLESQRTVGLFLRTHWFEGFYMSTDLHTSTAFL